MIYTLLITAEARNDELQAYIYYEHTLEGLGERFLAELEDIYKILKEHPQYFSFTDQSNTIRDVQLESFPYLVIYEIINRSVVVFAVHNCSKKPGNKF